MEDIDRNDFIVDRNEVIENIYFLFSCVTSDDEQLVSWAKERYNQGKVYYAEKIGNKILFGPSRFIGYKNNSKEKREKLGVGSGRKTDPILKKFYKLSNDSILMKEFNAFLNFINVDKNAEPKLYIPKEFDEEQFISSESNTYFICPTHIAGKKQEAWKSFEKNGIMAIGWEDDDYSHLDISEIISFYDNDRGAKQAFENIKNIKNGDIICCTNNNKGLFGIGVATSSYKYKEQIHYAGKDNNNDSYYSHYIDVAWLKEKYINADILNFNNEKMWEPYGTLTSKDNIPNYISNILFKNSDSDMKNDTTDYAKDEVTIPLNQILYGPPGTGKTYNTINKALEILNIDIKGKTRDEIKEVFNTNMTITDENNQIISGQIGFVTFHQSMSYEDFIEGIKPYEKEKLQLSYRIEDGIFKRISDIAFKNMLDSENFDEVFSRFIAPLIDREEEIEVHMQTVSFYITGITDSSIKYRTNSGTEGLTLSIDTLRRMYMGGGNNIILGGLEPYYNPILNILLKLADIKKQNYVLIIDEINRGNVSQIFGELITLIEEDKRLGNDEALTITLPYSKKPFGVPNNLYIIGTMNTADRSVEALDTALRRRFSFVEMMPNLELLKDKEIDGIDLSLLLETINKRIEILYDREHQIGHSYFLKVENIDDLRVAFKDKIIPLLQEYFFGDYGKIGLVLGAGFVKAKYDKLNNNIFASFKGYDGANDYSDKVVYEISSFENDINDFKEAINSLLNISEKQVNE